VHKEEQNRFQHDITSLTFDGKVALKVLFGIRFDSRLKQATPK